MTDPRPNAIVCIECGSVTLTDDPTIPCPECEDQGTEDPYCVSPAVVSDCPAPPGTQCEDPSHHWGRGDHVNEIER